MKGRKPKHPAIRIAEGNRGHRPIPNVPSLPVSELRPPGNLSAAAKKCWRRLAKSFADLGILTASDEAALVLLCENYALWMTCQKQARADGPIVKQNGQQIPNPYISLAAKLEATVIKMLVEFGATPSARTRLAVKKEETADAAAEFDAPQIRIASA